jgi:hypothetical protein
MEEKQSKENKRTKVKILWLDGYEQFFTPDIGSVIRYEALYISMVVDSVIKFIPIRNVRWFEEVVD